MGKIILLFLTLFSYNIFFNTTLYANYGIDVDFNNFNNIFNNAQNDTYIKNVIPNYEGTNIPETQVNSGNIDNLSQEMYYNSEFGNVINESIVNRPEYNVYELGNAIDNTNQSIKNRDNILSKSYCDPYNDIEYKICYKYYGQNLCPDNTYNKYCKSNLEMQCTSYESGCTTAGLELSSLPSDLEWSYDGGNGTLIIGKKTGANYWNGVCLVVDKTIEFEISNLELVEMFTLNRVVFDDYISVILNDNLIYIGPYGGTKLELITKYTNFSRKTVVDYGTGQNSCELSTIWNQYVNKDLTKLLKVGKNTLKMRVIVSGGGQGSMEFILKNRCCKEYVEKWTETCDIGEQSDKCNLVSKICTKKDYTIKFEGKYIPKKCAEYEQTYTCRSSQDSCFLHHNDCQNYNIDNCILETREFIDKANETEKFTYKCLTPRITPKECVQNIKCLDGSCYQLPQQEDNTEDFLKTISALEGVGETAKTLEDINITMLGGQGFKCGKKLLDFRDCCNDSGWGDFIVDCSTEERQLSEKKKQNYCIYIGKYCSEKEKITGICLEEKQTYCCFDSKLSKIINSSGKFQLGISFGNAETPNCRGLTPTEVQNLDFSIIDFSEVYQDMVDKMNKSDFENKMKQSLQRLQNGL